MLNKFGLKCKLHYFYIHRSSERKLKFLDADFPTVNPNDVLVLTDLFQQNKESDLTISTYQTALMFLRDYVAEFSTMDVELSPLFKTKNSLPSSK